MNLEINFYIFKELSMTLNLILCIHRSHKRPPTPIKFFMNELWILIFPNEITYDFTRIF